MGLIVQGRLFAPDHLLFKLRGLDFYPGGALFPLIMPASLDAHLSVLIRGFVRVADDPLGGSYIPVPSFTGVIPPTTR